MKHGLKALLVASTIALVPIVSAVPAQAHSQVSVVLDLGNVAFAYRDGYWDRDHRWHRWYSPEQRYRYRVDYRSHYYDWDHDRARDRGWHRSDRWWEHERRHRDHRDHRDHDHRDHRDHRR